MPDQLPSADPLPWLLEPADPSVRYWTLRDVFGRAADDAEVVVARESIAEQPLVRELFARQQPAGHWGDDATKPYTADGTLGVLALLVRPAEESLIAQSSGPGCIGRMMQVVMLASVIAFALWLAAGSPDGRGM